MRTLKYRRWKNELRPFQSLQKRGSTDVSEKKLLFRQHDTLDNEEENESFIGTSIFDHLAFNVFIFIMAIISVIIMFIVIKLIIKGEKMQVLVANLATIRGVKP